MNLRILQYFQQEWKRLHDEFEHFIHHGSLPPTQPTSKPAPTSAVIDPGLVNRIGGVPEQPLPDTGSDNPALRSYLASGGTGQGRVDTGSGSSGGDSTPVWKQNGSTYSADATRANGIWVRPDQPSAVIELHVPEGMKASILPVFSYTTDSKFPLVGTFEGKTYSITTQEEHHFEPQREWTGPNKLVVTIQQPAGSKCDVCFYIQ